jgi:Domain of unknown function (DUF4386)
MREGSSTEASGMGMGAHSNRQAALSAGVLLITATVANVIGTGLSRSLIDGPDYLTAVASNANRVTMGALLELVAAGASVGIAISLYPVLKTWGASLALGSVVFRTAEAVMYMLAAASLLSLLALSQRVTTAVAVDPASFRAVGDALLDVREQVALVAVFAFSVGGLLYSYLFYRSRLVPRWLSGWGIGAIILLMLACLLALFRQNELRTYTILALPLGVQEMVLAVWLIAKGFSTPATPPRSVQEEARREGGSSVRGGVAWPEARRTYNRGGSS